MYTYYCTNNNHLLYLHINRGGYYLRVAVLGAWGIGAKSAGCPGRCMGSTPSLPLHKYFLKLNTRSRYINIFFKLNLALVI